MLVEPVSIVSEAPGKLERDAEQFLSEATAAGRVLYQDAFRHLVTRFAGRAMRAAPCASSPRPWAGR